MRFNETYYLVRDGKKTATTRKLKSLIYYSMRIGHTCYAQKDDEPDIQIRIKRVSRMLLKEVAGNKFAEEGFTRPGEFIDAWCKIYGFYNPDEEVTFIQFEKVE